MRKLFMSGLCAGLAALSMLPGAAFGQQAEAYTNSPVDLYAGPGEDYPVVAQLPASLPLTVMGCISDYTWCDVAGSDIRGWVYAAYLSYPYQGSEVPIMSYGTVIGLPIVTFAIGSYWDHYYRNRPWYHDRDRWAHLPPPPPGPPRSEGHPPGQYPWHGGDGGRPPDYGHGGGHPGGPPPGQGGGSGRPPAPQQGNGGAHPGGPPQGQGGWDSRPHGPPQGQGGGGVHPPGPSQGHGGAQMGGPPPGQGGSGGRPPMPAQSQGGGHPGGSPQGHGGGGGNSGGQGDHGGPPQHN